MTDVDGFDIDRSIAQAWAEFQARLSEVISVIDESADLTIGTATADEEPSAFLRFSSPARDRVRCEAGIDPDPAQGPAQRQALQAAGWSTVADVAPGNPPSPSAVEAEATVLRAECAQEDSDTLAGLATSALRDVFGVAHPVFLAPDQLAEVLQPSPTPLEHSTGSGPGSDPSGQRSTDLERTRIGRGTSVEVDPEDLDATLPTDASHLSRLVDDELTSMYGHPPFRDAEGDVAIRVGTTMLFLRTTGDGKEVVVFAAVVHDVSGRSRAAEVINDLNVESRWVKFQVVRDRVFASISVLAQPFVPAHLHQAVRVLSEVADGIDEELASKLDGRTTFTSPD